MIKRYMLFFFIVTSLFANSVNNLSELKSFNKNQVQEISPSTMDKILKRKDQLKGMKVKRILLSQVKEVKEAEESAKKESDDPVTCENSKDVGPSLAPLADNITSSWGNNDTALVVFAVVGAVVIIAWIPYATNYLYTFFKDDSDKSIFIELSSDINYIFGGRSSSFLREKVDRSGILAGIKSQFGFGDKNRTLFGMAVLFGYHNIVYEFEKTKKEINYHGAYLMGGPTIFFGRGHALLNNSYGYLELTAGTSNRQDIGLISLARLGGMLNISETYSASNCNRGGYYLGGSIGAIYLGIKENEGMVDVLDKFNFTASLNLGYKF